jgi:Mg-chelatase subunit ChlD
MKPGQDQAHHAPSDETSAACVEVTIRWGASVLHVAHLSPPRSFHVGEAIPGDGGLDPSCFRLPSATLGAAQVPVILVEEGAVKLVLPDGAEGFVELAGGPRQTVAEIVEDGTTEACEAPAGARLVAFPLGSRASIEAFGVVIEVSSSHAARAVAGHYHVDRRSLPFIAGSAVAQLGVLAALWAFAPPLTDPGEELSADRIYQLQVALDAIAEKQAAAAADASAQESVAEAVAENKEGGTGTLSLGEEGAMGSPNTRASESRYGARGAADRADPHLSRQAALQDAAEFGMHGLLNTGAGGDPNAPTAPWGRDASLDGHPFSARGNMWGNDFGAGGLGLSGIGEGGGGLGSGAGARSGGRSVRAPARGPVAAPPPARPAVAPAPPPIAAPLAAAPLVPVLPAPAAEAAINPNGRFATTYRPGGGHLAAFESAVARGVVPEATREVVSDVGARYAPVVSVPAGKALGARADLERGRLAPGGGPFHLRLALQSTATAPDARPHLSVHLVLDVSGSMAGESMSQARKAAAALVDKLAPGDDFSFTTFSTEAAVRVPDGLVGPRREAIKRVIEEVQAQGGTNIGEGLMRGYEQASLRTIPADAVRVVLLVSDGRANEGITGGERLSRLARGAFQRGIQTSSFGLGSDYDGALMSSIATDGAGGYYYLRSADQIGPALATELDKRLDPVATAVEVRVRLKPGVSLLRVYGSRRLNDAEAARVRTVEVAADAHAERRDRIARNRNEDSEGGMRFFIPAFARDDSHALLFKLEAPPGAGTLPLGLVELKYKDRIARKNVVEELPLAVAYADSDAASGGTVDASVARTVQGFAAGEALTDAAARIARGDRPAAIALLAEREQILRQAAEALHEPLFLRDAARLGRLRGDAGSSSGAGDPLVLAMLLETAGRTHLR